MSVPSFNNVLVDALRAGGAETIATLAMLGQSHKTFLDYVAEGARDVLASAPSPASGRKSVWFWVHQGLAPQAAQGCWDRWVQRELAAVGPREKSTLLQDLLVEATAAAVSSGPAAPLLRSWENMLAFVPECAGRWTHEAMSAAFAHTAAPFGDASANIVQALMDQGFLVRRDIEIWCASSAGLLETALVKGAPALAGVLVRSWGSPSPTAIEQRFGNVDQTLAEVIEQGPGAWGMEEKGARLLACRTVLGETASGSLALSVGLRKAIAALEDGSGWLEKDLSALRELSLSCALSSQPTAAAPKKRF